LVCRIGVSRILLEGFCFSQLGEGLGTFGLNLGGDLGWFLVFGKKVGWFLHET